MRMAQRAGQRRLAAKAVIGLLVRPRQQQLERHGNPLHLVIGAVDRGCATAAQLLADQVAADLLACQIAESGAGDESSPEPVGSNSRESTESHAPTSWLIRLRSQSAAEPRHHPAASPRFARYPPRSLAKATHLPSGLTVGRPSCAELVVKRVSSAVSKLRRYTSQLPSRELINTTDNPSGVHTGRISLPLSVSRCRSLPSPFINHRPGFAALFVSTVKDDAILLRAPRRVFPRP